MLTRLTQLAALAASQLDQGGGAGSTGPVYELDFTSESVEPTIGTGTPSYSAPEKISEQGLLVETDDFAYLEGSPLAAFLNEQEGTLYVEWYDAGTVASSIRVLAELKSSGSFDGEVGILQSDPTVSDNGTRITGATVVISGSVARLDLAAQGGGTHRAAIAYKDGDNAACYDGGTVQTETDAGLPASMNRLSIGGRNDASSHTFPANAYIRKVRYYNRRMTNEELVAVTEPQEGDPAAAPVYNWQIFSASSGNDVGSTFPTSGTTAGEVFHEATHSITGMAALVLEAGFPLGDNETYGNPIGIINHGSSYLAAGANVDLSGVNWGGDFIPINGINYHINSGATRTAGVYLKSQT